jgi:hypothetical protein
MLIHIHLLNTVAYWCTGSANKSRFTCPCPELCPHFIYFLSLSECWIPSSRVHHHSNQNFLRISFTFCPVHTCLHTNYLSCESFPVCFNGLMYKTHHVALLSVFHFSRSLFNRPQSKWLRLIFINVHYCCIHVSIKESILTLQLISSSKYIRT